MAASKVASSKAQLEAGEAKGGGSSREKDNSSEETAERPSSPDVVKCAICLGDVVNRSSSNSCSHQFCFGCLLEWSKVKPECPLCKSSFRSIYHNFRSTSDYDEYVVPAPAVPHLSIRLTASAGSNYRLSPFIRVLEARNSQLGHSHSPLAIPLDHFHAGFGGGFHLPPPPPPPLAHAINPFNSSASSSSFRPEYFSDLLGLSNFRLPLEVEDAAQMRGCQNRRRRYDRNEWVQPFGAGIQHTAMSSVDYLRTNPSVLPRVRNWLFREINVLIGLQRTRDQMSSLFGLIMHLISHYDIRSRDFREAVYTHLGARTPHFQHELFHFILSGMGMDEYDRVAEYNTGNNRNSNTTSSTSNSATSAPRRHGPPEVITLDSDDEERSAAAARRSSLRSSSRRHEDAPSDIIVVESSDDEDDIIASIPPLPPYRLLDERSGAGSTSRNYPGSSTSSSNINSENSLSSSSGRTFTDGPSVTISLGAHELGPEAYRRRNNSSSRVIVDADPEMPVLEPQVFPYSPPSPTPNYRSSLVSNLFSRSNDSENITASRAAEATATVPDFINTRGNAYDPTYSSPELVEQNFSNARQSTNSDRHDRVQLMDAEFDFDVNLSLEHYSSPPRESSRPLASPDFPILQFRQFRRNFLRDSNHDRYRSERRDVNSRSIYDSVPSSSRFGSSHHPSRGRTAEGGSAFVAYDSGNSSSSREELVRPPRPSCIFDSSRHQPSTSAAMGSASRGGRGRPSSPSPAFRIDLYPHGMSSSQVMDLSRNAGLIPSTSRSGASSAERMARPSCPPPPVVGQSQSPLNYSTSKAGTSLLKENKTGKSKGKDEESESEGELECLGTFPIEKKPPLAVITLSSDDDDDGVKLENVGEGLNILSTDEEATLLDGFGVTNWESHSLMPTDCSLLDDVSTLHSNAYGSSSSSNTFPDGPLLHVDTSNSSIDVQNPPSPPSPIPSTSTTSATWPKRLIHESAKLQDSSRKRKSSKQTSSGELAKSTKRVSSQSQQSSPKRRRRRLIVPTSSDENNDESQPCSSQSLSMRTMPPSPVKIPKKRKFVESPPPPTPVLTEDSDSSSSDYEARTSQAGKATSKRNSSPSKKKHKSKAKKSKKSKRTCKHKHKLKKRRSRSRSSSKGDKQSKSRAESNHLDLGDGGSSTADGKGKSDSGSSRPSTSKEKRHSRSVAPRSSGVVSTRFEFNESNQPGRLLDLSLSRSDNAMSSISLHSQLSETIDLGIPISQTSLQSDNSSDPRISPQLSNDDSSLMFNSPSWFM